LKFQTAVMEPCGVLNREKVYGKGKKICDGRFLVLR